MMGAPPARVGSSAPDGGCDGCERGARGAGVGWSGMAGQEAQGGGRPVEAVRAAAGSVQKAAVKGVWLWVIR